jgi:hypothetical protein
MSSSHRQVGPTRLPLAAAAFLVLVCVAFLGLSGWREWTSRRAVLTGAEIDVRNLAESLSQYVDDTFELSDTLVVGFVNQLEAAGTGPGAMARLQSAINMRKGALGRIRGLFVYDDTGRWLASSADVDLTLFNNSDRDYFKQHSRSPDRGTLIGHPVKSRSGGEWIITVSRRFDRPDGSFGGVVLASIDAGHFAEYFRQFDVGPHGVAAEFQRRCAGTRRRQRPSDKPQHQGHAAVRAPERWSAGWQLRLPFTVG